MLRKLTINKFHDIDHLDLEFTDGHGNTSQDIVFMSNEGQKTTVLDAIRSALRGESEEGVQCVFDGVPKFDWLPALRSPELQRADYIVGHLGKEELGKLNRIWHMLYYREVETDTARNTDPARQSIITLIAPLLSNVPDIYVVDEPELHIPTNWIRHIHHHMRQFAPKTQFIFGTLSDEVYEMVYSFERFFIYPDK